MPAEIDKTTGVPAMLFVEDRGWPWHRDAQPVPGLMTADEVLERCPALAFEVEKRPLYIPTPDVTFTQVPGWMATIRLDTMAVLGIVSDSYTVYPFRNVLDIGQSLTGLGAAYETVGSLLGGRLMFASMELGDDFFIDGDPRPHQKRLLLGTGHDGRHASPPSACMAERSAGTLGPAPWARLARS